MARPKGTGKPKGEKYIKTMIMLPPELWIWVQRIPEGKRSGFIQEAILEKLEREGMEF